LSHDAAASRSTSSGMNRPIASFTVRSSWAGLIVPATDATWTSTNAAASGVSPMVSAATRRALHADSRPETTSCQCRGSRYRSSTHSPRNHFPASVANPTAATNSATAYSATDGAPCPARDNPVWLPPRST
jgi:hypothetical protein